MGCGSSTPFGWCRSCLWLARGYTNPESSPLDVFYLGLSALFWIGHRLCSTWLAYCTEAYRPLLRQEPVRFVVIPLLVTVACFAIFLPDDTALPWSRAERVVAMAIHRLCAGHVPLCGTTLRCPVSVPIACAARELRAYEASGSDLRSRGGRRTGLPCRYPVADPSPTTIGGSMTGSSPPGLPRSKAISAKAPCCFCCRNRRHAGCGSADDAPLAATRAVHPGARRNGRHGPAGPKPISLHSDLDFTALDPGHGPRLRNPPRRAGSRCAAPSAESFTH